MGELSMAEVELRDPPVPVLQEDGSLLIRILPNGDRLIASKGWLPISEDISA